MGDVEQPAEQRVGEQQLLTVDLSAVFQREPRALTDACDARRVERAALVALGALLRLRQQVRGGARSALLERVQRQRGADVERAGALDAQQALVARHGAQIHAPFLGVEGQHARRLRSVHEQQRLVHLTEHRDLLDGNNLAGDVVGVRYYDQVGVLIDGLQHVGGDAQLNLALGGQAL